jgi:radical SAM protein with 4Fe4S-binding SPASM domain
VAVAGVPVVLEAVVPVAAEVAVQAVAADVVVAAVAVTDSHSCEYTPHSLLFQWHITNRCNNRCVHCYQDSYEDEQSDLSDLMQVLEQYRELLTHFNSHSSSPVKGHITVTGGEPFTHPHFMDLLHRFREDRELYSFAILTNGSFIDRTMAKSLKNFSPSFVQVSIDGTRKTHDELRVKGDYARTLTALRELIKEGIPTLISFTAHRKNFREFPSVAKIGRKIGVNKVWSDRLIPEGNGREIGEMVLTQEETREYVQILKNERDKSHLFSKTVIGMERALQFLESGSIPYHCSAGDCLITVLPNGDLLPCRRLPIKVGNVHENSLINLYNNPIFCKLRSADGGETCSGCLYQNLCRGGLRCLAYAVCGELDTGDPGCWIAGATQLHV